MTEITYRHCWYDDRSGYDCFKDYTLQVDTSLVTAKMVELEQRDMELIDYREVAS